MLLSNRFSVPAEIVKVRVLDPGFGVVFRGTPVLGVGAAAEVFSLKSQVDDPNASYTVGLEVPARGAGLLPAQVLQPRAEEVAWAAAAVGGQ